MPKIMVTKTDGEVKELGPGENLLVEIKNVQGQDLTYLFRGNGLVASVKDGSDEVAVCERLYTEERERLLDPFKDDEDDDEDEDYDDDLDDDDEDYDDDLDDDELDDDEEFDDEE